jgi:hypothetical protein
VNDLKRLESGTKTLPSQGLNSAQNLWRCGATPPFERLLPPTQLREFANYVVVRNDKAIRKASANADVAAQRTLSKKRTQCEGDHPHLIFPNGSVEEERVPVSFATPVVLPQLCYPGCITPVVLPQFVEIQ